MKILVLVFYIILFSATVVDLTAATTAATKTTATTTTTTTTTAKISSSSSTSTKTPLTQPLSTQKEAHGTGSHCTCQDGTTIALSGHSTMTGSNTESPPVSRNTSIATVKSDSDDADVSRILTANVKRSTTTSSTKEPSATSLTIKSSATVSTIKPSATVSSIKPSATSSTIKPSATSLTIKPSATVTTIKPSATASTIKPSATSLTIKPSATASTIKPSATSLTIKPSATASAIKPNATHITIKPSATASTIKLSAIASTIKPSATASTIKPSATSLTIKPSATVSTLKPSATTSISTVTEQHTHTSVDLLCSQICQTYSTNATMPEVDSTTVTKPATKLTTVLHPNIAPKWDDVTLEIPLVIVTNSTFTSELKDPESSVYREMASEYKTELHNFYSSTPHFDRININGFSEGSVKCKYSVVLDTKNLTKNTLRDVIEFISNNRTNKDELDQIQGIGPVLVSETLQLMQKDIKTADDKFNKLCETYGDKMCEYDRKCIIKTDNLLNQTPYCVYKCNLEENRCGEHGTCSVDVKGNIACKCKEDPLYVFHGERCDIKEEKLLLSKNYIIAIAAGGGGAVILLLFIAMICLCRKWNKANKASQFYRNRSTKSPRDRESVAYEDDKGIQMENSRIENVYMSEHGHENNGFAVDSAAPSADGSSMRYEKGRYYRVVKDPELGSDTLIYQPSNLNRPIQRESTISKDEEPDPLRSHYDYIDTDTVYKIKRPNVRSNTIDSNGHPRTVL